MSLPALFRRPAAAATLLLAAALAPPPAGASPQRTPSATEQREPTAAERASFDAYFEQRVQQQAAANNGRRPMPPLFAPAFDIQRRRGTRPWSIVVRVDSSPRHAAQDVCQQLRTSFIYDAPARQWREAAEPVQPYVWLAQPATPCSAPRASALLAQPLPWNDVTELLRQQDTLLARARLLFAGNSQCARQRALDFKLSAIEPAAPTASAPVMFGLVFHSDRDTVATVAVRKHRGEYTAWDVSCPG